MLKYKGNHNKKLLKIAQTLFLPCIHAFPCMFAYVSINNCKYFPFSLAKYKEMRVGPRLLHCTVKMQV